MTQIDQLPLLWEITGPVGRLTLQRPEQRNALSRSLVAEMDSIFMQVAEDPNVSVVVVRGSGTKAFCAGADLKEREGMPDDEVVACVDAIRHCFERLAQLPQITIACLNGVALGGGLELALACDLRYASSEAKLGLPETRLAIIPGAGGTQRLPRIVGVARAKELIFTGRVLPAAQALEVGLVHAVFPAEDLDREVNAVIENLTTAGPLALRAAKWAINLGMRGDLQQGLLIEKDAYAQVVPTYDRREGLLAFKEKRPPIYKGH